MGKKLWEASNKRKLNSNLYKFENFLENRFNYKVSKNYKKILKWSIQNPKYFWSSIWDFSKIKGKKNNKFIITKDPLKNKYLNGSKLNFAENLLTKKNDEKAITFISENGYREIRSWKELSFNVSNIYLTYKRLNLRPKDRVAAYLPNIIETVEFFLASSSLGAIWSSCSPDFGTEGVIERFKQIDPKILIIGDRYYYNGKQINIIERLSKILKEVKSIKTIIIINYPGKEPLEYKIKSKKILYWNKLKKNKAANIQFKKFDFDHELAILYSSGTTGKPKCICHKTGGVLLQHLKEHKLHCEINPGDNVFYFTTCGWMMWNWLVSSLASKASIVLFDGFPMYKRNDLLLRITEDEKITLLGVSAKYIDTLNKLNVSVPKNKLKSLKTICSTGSPLSEDSFEYVYKKIKSDVHLSSISGGTDIVSCFVLGNIYQPVIKGQIQNSGLGMDVGVYSEKGNLLINRKGELICKNSFPSMPKKFWKDKNNAKYKNAYFNKYKYIWYHGDYAERKSNGGFVIYGRSDATLNPGGVRLGTAEIYSVVEKFKQIKEGLVIGQSWDNDIRIILFLVMNKGYSLDEILKKKIKMQIKSSASPRHVPSKIIKVNDLPRTKNGKIVELAVKNIVEGNKIKNKEALVDPKVLEYFKNLQELND
tara:strand:+ start:226 stop:2175 length:1950 start_codon:yes stop_codon:yes gene_type:complete